jgi:hypothetical protein
VFVDAALATDDGVRVPVHRLLLCAHSPVWDAAVRRQQDGFAEGRGDGPVAIVSVPGVSARAIACVRAWMYTGLCDLASDETVIGTEVLRVRKCE